eukprot:Em0018g923a
MYIQLIVVQLFLYRQRYTQRSGARPFGVSFLVVGFDQGTPKLYQTEPAGTYHEWKANATGRNAKTVREFLEKYYTEESTQTRDEAIILAVRGLLEVVQSGSKNIELAVMEKGKKIEFLDTDQIEKYIQHIEKIRLCIPGGVLHSSMAISVINKWWVLEKAMCWPSQNTELSASVHPITVT